MGSSDITKEDIVKKFDLPERKTKIETILKLQRETPVYCICHSTDISRFMICCEKCDEWYHGDCINLKQREAKYIKKWYCHVCIERYDLEVVYYPRDKKNKSRTNKKDTVKHSVPTVKTEDSSCGMCSNCLQNEECGNKGYIKIYKKVKLLKKPLGEDEETSSSTSTKTESNTDYPKRCHLPYCENIARSTSKYCSHKCGLALARMRLLHILPYRINEHKKVPCIADELDKAKLENLRLKKKFIFERIQKLDKKEKKLLDLISRAKRVPIVKTTVEVEDENKMNCVTCGWEISTRSAIRHMDICFRKFESQTAVVGSSKSNADNCNIFCDYFDKSNNTYCMRLRYLCPDHYKPKKSKENEVCGCPIIKVMSKSIFSGAEKYCQQAKKDCDLHYNWEILAITDIDLERMREWHQIGQITIEERTILKQMTDRSGVLPFLLHSTTVEDDNPFNY